MAKKFLGELNLTSAIQLNGSAGTSGQVLTSAGAGALPTWTTPSGSTPTSSESFRTTDLTMTTAGTAYTVATLSLAAGTYLIQGKVIVASTANNAMRCTARLLSGATVISEAEAFAAGAGASTLGMVTLPVFEWLTLASTTTITLNAYSTLNSSVIKANPVNNSGAGNASSGLLAIKFA